MVVESELSNSKKLTKCQGDSGRRLGDLVEQ